MGMDKLSFEGDQGGSDHCAYLTGSNRKRPCPVVTWLFLLLFPVLFFSFFFPYFFKLFYFYSPVIWKSTGKNTKKKVPGKSTGKKSKGKSHVTTGQSLFRLLPVKHAQWSDPPRSPSNDNLSVPIYYLNYKRNRLTTTIEIYLMLCLNWVDWLIDWCLTLFWMSCIHIES